MQRSHKPRSLVQIQPELPNMIKYFYKGKPCTIVGSGLYKYLIQYEHKGKVKTKSVNPLDVYKVCQS